MAQDTYIVSFNPTFSDTDKTVTHNILWRNKDVTKTSLLKGIPTDWPSYRIYSLPVHSHSILPKAFKMLQQKDTLYYYVGADRQKQEKCIIIDANFNQDFSDDSIYVFPFKYYETLDLYTGNFPMPQVNIYPYHFDGSRISQTKSSISILPFERKSKNIEDEEYYLYAEIATNAYARGDIKIQGSNVRINEKRNTLCLIPRNIDRESHFDFISFDDSTSLTYSIGDTITIVNRMIYLEKVENNNLYLKDLGAWNDSSKTGCIVPDMYAYSIEENRKIHLNPLLKDKYTLIDFWGSWCSPCIEALPKMREIYLQVKEREDVLILGIALESPKDLPKTLKIMQRERVEWPNVWEVSSNNRQNTSLHRKLKIDSYPTLIVLDKNGRIVARSGETGIANPYKERESIIKQFFELIAK